MSQPNEASGFVVTDGEARILDAKLDEIEGAVRVLARNFLPDFQKRDPNNEGAAPEPNLLDQ